MYGIEGKKVQKKIRVSFFLTAVVYYNYSTILTHYTGEVILQSLLKTKQDNLQEKKIIQNANHYS